MAKSGCVFTFFGVGVGGGGVAVSFRISIQCLHAWYSSAGYGVFHCGKRVIPVQDMGYFSGIWGIPLDMAYSTPRYGVFHMGYAVNWV